MIWTICALISFFIVIVSAKIFFDKKHGSSRMIFVFCGLFVCTYLMYLPPFLACNEFISAIFGNLIHTLQVITLDADFLEYYEVIKVGTVYPIVENIYTIILGSMHILLPAISAMTAVTVLLRCFSSMQLYFANLSKKPMFIFSELNEKSFCIAKSLCSIKCDIIFAGVDESIINGKGDELRGVIFKEERINELNVKGTKNKNVFWFCISKDEDQALSETLSIIEKSSALNEVGQEKTHIYLFSQNDYSIYIDSSDKGLVNVYCINEYENHIYALLDKYPLFDNIESNIHVLLHGLSPINIVALKAIAWCGQLDGYSIKISVVGIGLENIVNELKLSVPNLFTERYDLNIYDCSSEKEIIDIVSQNCADANYIIVSENTDNQTMEKGILLRRLFYRLDTNYENCPKIFCYVKDTAKFNILKNLTTAESSAKRKVSYDLIPFGELTDVFSYDKIVDSNLEDLAKNVHCAYEEIFSDGPIDVKEALKRYNLFEVNKRSNRANALHIRYKLRLLGLDYTNNPDAESVKLSDYYTKESLQRLSVSEHDRWMSFLETEGWIQAKEQDVNTYRKSGISRGRHNCPILKMHPYICPYEDLKDLSLNLEGKDTTIYDEELILRIPDILTDKWNVSGKKYTITKLKKQEETDYGNERN